MQAIMLAAGTGSRLGKYTKENTKCMLEVNGESLIKQALEKINAAGITKLTLVVGYKHENLIEHVGKKYKNVNISYIKNDIYDKTNNIYSLWLAAEALKSDDTILLESDLIFEEKMLKDLIEDNRPSLALVDKYQSWMDGTSVEIDENDNILNFYGKKNFKFHDVKNYYKTVNIYKFSKEFSQNVYVPFLEAYMKSQGDNEYYESVLNVLTILDNTELKAKVLNGEKWYEIDDVQDKQNAEIIFANNNKEKFELLQKRYGGYWKFPELIDFCYLVNPYFPNQKYLDETTEYFHDLVSQYPSGLDTQNLLAGKMFSIEQENTLVGNGAAELIKHLGKIDGKFGIMLPTFNEYTNAIGHERFIKGNGLNGYNLNDLIDLLDKVQNLILVNPDNPSGNFISKKDVLFLVKHAGAEGKNIILDESFLDFAENAEDESLLTQDIIDDNQNLIIIKSISKSYGVPGLRLGALFTSNENILEEIRKELPVWNINSFAEYFLQTIGKYKKDYKLACEKIKSSRENMYHMLQNITFLKVHKSQANYFMCEVLDRSSLKLCEDLLNFNVYAKNLSKNESFEGKQYVRLAVRDEIDNIKLIKALKCLS